MADMINAKTKVKAPKVESSLPPDLARKLFSCRLPVETLRKLRIVARQTRMSQSELVENGLRRLFDDRSLADLATAVRRAEEAMR